MRLVVFRHFFNSFMINYNSFLWVEKYLLISEMIFRFMNTCIEPKNTFLDQKCLLKIITIPYLISSIICIQTSKIEKSWYSCAFMHLGVLKSGTIKFCTVSIHLKNISYKLGDFIGQFTWEVPKLKIWIKYYVFYVQLQKVYFHFQVCITS